MNISGAVEKSPSFVGDVECLVCVGGGSFGG